MGAIWYLFVTVLVIIIVISLVVSKQHQINKTAKFRTLLQSNTANVPKLAPPTPTPAHRAGHGTTKKKSGFWSTLIYIIVALILIAILNGVRSCNKNDYIIKTENQNNNSQLKWVIEKTIDVAYDDEYKEIIYLPEGKGLSFENSSEPYSVINMDKEEHCGVKNEDISSKFPGSKANTELKFKSNNGKKGHVTIITWILK